MSEPKVSGWVIYQIVDGEPKFYGILKDKDSADKELEIINRNPVGGIPFHAKAVMLIGWGIFLSDDNDPKPRGN